MIDSKAPSPAVRVKALNEMPINQHVLMLLRQEKAEVDPSNLMLVNLLMWASDNHYQDWHLGQQEAGAAVLAQEADPEAVNENLTDERILEAQTLERASAILVSRLLEILR